MENFKKNTKWEILTPSGWSPFEGVKKNEKKGGFHLHIEHKTTGKKLELLCSKNHKLKLIDGNFTYPYDITPDSVLDGDLVVTDVIPLEDEESNEYYDVIGVEKKNEYYTNDVVSHNCAHINENIVTELWLSVAPALSTGGSAILISTPNGTENLFYRIWSQALSGENDFKTIELPWTVHPDRDQAWFVKESAVVRASKGEVGVQQEFFCQFLGSGDTFIGAELISQIEAGCFNPSKHSEFLRLNVFEHAIEGESYLATSDVASGKADDFTTISISKISTGEIVLDYKDKIVPQEFAHLLMRIGFEYNTAILCPEQNTYGLIVCEILRAEKYPRLYYQKMKSITEVGTYQAEQFELPGWRTDEGTRPTMLAQLDHMLSTGGMKVYSKLFTDELKNFIWKNNKPQAKKGKNDDLVIAYAINAKLLATANEALNGISDGKPEISFNDMRQMLGGLSRREKVLDVTNKEIYNPFERVGNPSSRDPSKPWNWIL